MPSALDEMFRAWIREAVSGTVRQVLTEFAPKAPLLAGKQRLLTVAQAAHSYGT